MRIIHSINEMQNISLSFKRKHKTIGLVPTMGALHDGHLSLIRKARLSTDISIVSIFINPKQFGPNEDFFKYPRLFSKDKRLCSDNSVDYIFAPDVQHIYPENFSTSIKVEKFSNILCGKFRPGHFKGVATIVVKLFNIILPDKAFFGEKDFQQLRIIEKMTLDLNFQTKIIACPIVREKNGLALSSRNVFLKPSEQSDASLIFKSLNFAKAQIKQKIKNNLNISVKDIIDRIRHELKQIPNSHIEYVKICNNCSINELKTTIKLPARILIAIYLGKTRLIDNILVK